MNLETHIKPELWSSIQSTYQAENYSHAILDSIHYLSDILREKSGSDGDGQKLVGEAMGGDPPKLRINKFQTQTEKDEQKGIVQILMGVYQGIRNPRSHDLKIDDQRTADSIILFVNYLLSVLDQSSTPFTIDDFLDRVFDPSFVALERYADLLVDEIPQKRLLDVAIEVHRRKQEGEGNQLSLLFRSLYKKLNNDQLSNFMKVVSEEFKTLSNEQEIRLNLQILLPKMWEMLDEAPRIRVENMIIKYIKDAEYYISGECSSNGAAIATWSNSFVEFFALKSQLANVLMSKLGDQDADDRRYVFNFFSRCLPKIITQDFFVTRTVRIISKLIREGDNDARNLSLYTFPEAWQIKFVTELSDVFKEDGTLYFDGVINMGDIPF